MSDVLTKSERELVEFTDRELGLQWADNGADVHRKSKACILRLVAEVERKNDYATRMDALAEERLVEIGKLKDCLRGIVTFSNSGYLQGDAGLLVNRAAFMDLVECGRRLLGE